MINYYKLEKELWKIAIFETNKKHQCDFVNYIASLDKDSNRYGMIRFIEPYTKILPFLNINIEDIYNNSIHLLGLVESDSQYNIPKGRILAGLMEKCFVDSNVGLQLFYYSIRHHSINNDIVASTITGLYNKKGSEFYLNHLLPIINQKNIQIGLLLGLSNIKKVGFKEADIFIGLYDSKKLEEGLTVPLINILFSILRSNVFLDEDICVLKCFLSLNEIIQIDNPSVIIFILTEFSFLDKYHDEKINLILSLIAQRHFSIKIYVKYIADAFLLIKGVEYFEKLLFAIATFCPFESIAKDFENVFQDFDKNEFDKLLINLLIQNQASFRFIGKGIFNVLSVESSYIFNADLLELEPIEQYKLCVSIFQNPKEPDFILPCLIPLIKSKSKIVREIFLCKVEEYTEDYRGYVIDTLEMHLNQNNIEHLEILARIKKYLTDFYEANIKVKKNIQELNPYFTQNKLLSEFNFLYRRNFDELLQKNMDKNSLFSLFSNNTVHLKKGGGWTMGGDKEISKLGRFETSFKLPRNYFIFPDQYELETTIEMRDDWSENDFDLIKDCLSHE